MADPIITAAQRQQFQTAKAFLTELGLGGLFSYNEGVPGGWLWQQILSGVDTEEELMAAIEQTDVWRSAFPTIVEQRRRAAAGDPTRVWTVAEITEYRASGTETMRRYGLPSWFYDQKSDFDALILNNISADELRDRIAGAWNAVANVDPDIKDQFRQFYGVGQGDGALAAYFLDPARTEAQLEKQALAAYAGGIARDFGINLDRDRAEKFPTYGYGERGISEVLAGINNARSVLTEGITETEDLTTDTAFDSAVQGDANATSALERRVIRRRAVNQSSQGGALLTQEGLTGSASAR